MSDYIKLRRPPDNAIDPRNLVDVQKLGVALRALGYDAEPADIEWAWQDFSDSMDAGWMMVLNPPVDALIVKERLEEVADDC